MESEERDESPAAEGEANEGSRQDEGVSKPTTLAEKVEFLFKTVRPPGRKREYSTAEVAAGITELTGDSIRGNTIWNIKRGNAINPTMRTLEGLAAFFGVSADYFFNDEASRQIGEQLEMLTLIRDAGVNAAQFRGLLELSPEGQRMIAGVIENAARMERDLQGRNPRKNAQDQSET